MNGLVSENELYHHGILGMKWGVRRFQNEDGTLTDAGKKRYGSMSEKKLYKTLKKEFRDKRAKTHGGSNRWMNNLSVGENEDKLRSIDRENRKKYESSKEYKEWSKKVDRLNKKFERGKIDDPDKFDEEWERLRKERPKEKYNTLSFVKVYASSGSYYTNNFVNRGGKDLSIARLKDLGYSEDVAKDFVKKMAKKGYTLGDI